jgi:hypothetical protein
LVLPLQPIKCRIVPFDGTFDFRIYLYYHVKMPTKTNRKERKLEIPTLDKT